VGFWGILAAAAQHAEPQEGEQDGAEDADGDQRAARGAGGGTGGVAVLFGVQRVVGEGDAFVLRDGDGRLELVGVELAVRVVVECDPVFFWVEKPKARLPRPANWYLQEVTVAWVAIQGVSGGGGSGAAGEFIGPGSLGSGCEERRRRRERRWLRQRFQEGSLRGLRLR
jgi:hypothetical protein